MDLFSDEVLMDPYPYYKELRETGAAVFLDSTDCWVLPRYAEVRAADADWQTFSAAGVALTDNMKRALSGNLLSSDPPDHDTLRRVIDYGLSPRTIRQQAQVNIERRAEALVEEVVAQQSFDAVEDLAQALPVSVVIDLIGFPQEGRGRLLDWADGSFNAFGPANERTLSGFTSLEEMFNYLYTVATPDRLAPGSMGRKIYAAAERGEISPESCPRLMAAFATAGLDTTINAISSAIWLFALHPDQWDLVRENPDRMIPMAFNEVLRIESPIQAFGRLVTRNHEMDGVALPEGSQVILLFGSANRDERKWTDPERFDISRNPVDHLAFGYGVHRCAGQGLARIEFSAVLHHLARRVQRFEAEDPERHLNNVVRGLSSLPVSVQQSA